MSRIFLGNLGFGIRDDELREVFAEYGDVEAARSAVESPNGRDVNGRQLEVRLVIPWESPGFGRAVRRQA